MRKLIFALALVGAQESLAKEWTWTAWNVAGGKAAVVSTGSTCNYQSSIAAGRKAAETVAEGAFNVKGADNEAACPKAPKKEGK